MQKPSKGKQLSRQPLRRQFHSPYSMEECRARLQAVPTLHTKWRVADDDKVMFSVYRRRDLLRLIISFSVPEELSGTLHRQADDTTAVELEAGQTVYEFTYRLNYFFIGAALMLSGVVTTLFMGVHFVPLAGAIMFMIGLPLFIWVIRSRETERLQLLIDVQTLLDGEEPSDTGDYV